MKTNKLLMALAAAGALALSGLGFGQSTTGNAPSSATGSSTTHITVGSPGFSFSNNNVGTHSASTVINSTNMLSLTATDNTVEGSVIYLQSANGDGTDSWLVNTSADTGCTNGNSAGAGGASCGDDEKIAYQLLCGTLSAQTGADGGTSTITSTDFAPAAAVKYRYTSSAAMSASNANTLYEYTEENQKYPMNDTGACTYSADASDTIDKT